MELSLKLSGADGSRCSLVSGSHEGFDILLVDGDTLLGKGDLHFKPLECRDNGEPSG